ncbi:MAG: helix-turn-helix transcriptional regulator [Clostridia bacterium]|nr:helix-turn-helix transcriptional regulator [Clostridia bacterium]
MIRAYNEIYLNSVMRNLAALFDMAINAEQFDANEFAQSFASSDVAKGIENGVPDILVGKSATELLSLILDREVEYDSVPMDRTPEYWAGWVLAYAQWSLNRSFEEIISVMPFDKLVRMYYPYHEADERKTVEVIAELFPKVSALKIIRQKRKLTQEQLALLSGVNVRSIRSYEQGDNEIAKAQAETLQMLAKALDCTIEELLEG